MIVFGVYAQFDINLVTEMEKEMILERDLKYEYFITDGNYLCITEFFTKTILILNLDTFTLSEIKWREGRGPTEVLSLIGLDIIDGILFINDPISFKFIRIDLQSMEYLDDITVDKQVPFFDSFDDRYIAVTPNHGFGKRNIPYLNDIDFDQKTLLPLEWTSINKSPEMTEDNFDGWYTSNAYHFIRFGNRLNHLLVANFNKEEFYEYTYDEPYRKQEAFDPSQGNLTQVLSFYIHDAEIGENNKLYLLAEGRTKKKRFRKDELTILDLETMQYVEETIKLPKEFDNIVITENYFIGFNEKEFSLNIYQYE